MNDTQWIFEFESYVQGKTEKYDEYKALMESWRSMLINLLGLNLMPIEEEEGGRLRLPKNDEIMPFILAAGREEVVSSIAKKLEEYKAQEEADGQIAMGNDVTLDQVEESFPDALFPTDPGEFKKFLKSIDPVTQRALDAFVLPLDKKDETEVKSDIDIRRPKKSRVKIE